MLYCTLAVKRETIYNVVIQANRKFDSLLDMTVKTMAIVCTLLCRLKDILTDNGSWCTPQTASCMGCWGCLSCPL